MDQPYIITSTEEVVEVSTGGVAIEVQHFVSNALGMEVAVPTANDAFGQVSCVSNKESITESVSA